MMIILVAILPILSSSVNGDLNLTSRSKTQPDDTSTSAYEECSYIPDYAIDSAYQIVQSCPAYSDKKERQNCHNSTSGNIGIIPVTSRPTGITFRNVFCAICHKQYSEIIRWQLHLSCANGKHITSTKDISNLDCKRTIIKAPYVKLKPCSDVLVRRKRAVSEAIKPVPDKQPFGYSTLLNFAADGTTHVLLTSDADEFLYRSECGVQDTIYNPFTKQCLRTDCQPNQISYDGDCIQSDLALGDKENVCMDFYIRYRLNDDLPKPIKEEDFKQALARTFIEHFNFSSQDIILPYNLFANTSQCLNPKGFMSSYLLWNSTNIAELLSENLQLDIHRDPTGTNQSVRCDTQDIANKAVFSLKFTGVRSDVKRLNDTLETKQFENILNFTSIAMTYLDNKSHSHAAGSGCIYDIKTQDLTHRRWCDGFEQEYFNDEFSLEVENDVIVGVQVNETGKVYRKSEFQFTAVLEGPFWGKTSQVASTCDLYPRITAIELECNQLGISPSDYDLLENRRIIVHSFDEIANLKIPFETERKLKIKSTFGLNEYRYLWNNTTRHVTLSEIMKKYIKPNVSVCIPDELVIRILELQAWNKVSVNQSCSYLQDFGHGSAIAGSICSAISLVAMAITLITYSIFKSLRTLPGVSLMNLTVAVMLSQLSFHIGLLVPTDLDDTNYVCFSMAVFTHYCTLASFTWMNVMAYSSYRAFGAKLKTRLIKLSRRHLAFNALYGWGLPALIVLICAIVDYSLRQEKLIGYGVVATAKIIDKKDPETGETESIELRFRSTSSCWIGNSRAAVIIFGIPLVYCMTVNLALFIKTCLGMREKPKGGKPKTILRRDSGSGNLKKRNEMWIHCRLSAQYGFAWIIAIIIVLIGTYRSETQVVCYILYILNLIFNILNGLAGLFIFFAFIFNKRILHLYKAKFGQQRGRLGQSVFNISSSRVTSLASIGESISPPASPLSVLEQNNNFPDIPSRSRNNTRYFSESENSYIANDHIYCQADDCQCTETRTRITSEPSDLDDNDVYWEIEPDTTSV